MKVSDYRDLTSALSDVFASFRSAATGHETRLEGERLRRAADELRAARCPRASIDDWQKAQRLLALVGAVLMKHDRECRVADANLQRMAYGAEWR